MAIRTIIKVSESTEELKKLIKNCSYKHKPRLKMLYHISSGVISTEDLVAKVKANKNSIASWKKRYETGGLEGLLADNRGGNNPPIINETQKKEVERKLSEPEGGFTSYKQVTEWINATFSLEMSYHAVNQYLKRSFGTKLKVGRKSHVKKDAAAGAVFKKPAKDPETY